MLRNDVELVQKALIEISQNPELLRAGGIQGVSEQYGICTNIGVYLKYRHGVKIESGTAQILRSFWGDWEHFSGDNWFPVPRNKHDKYTRGDAEFYAQLQYSKIINMYDKNTEYGQLRWELIDHLIYKMELYLTEN